MSTDTISLFDVAIPGASPEWLLERFRDSPVVLAEVVERYRSRWTVQAWSIEPAPVTSEPLLWGPGGFSFSFVPGMLRVYHVMRFSEFACDAAARSQIRALWHYLAKLLGSIRAIYTHELMPYEGASLDEIERGLRSRVGPPADNFEQLCQAEYFGPRAWYIDDFADMERRHRDANHA